MSLYHETADILSAPASSGSLKSRLFSNKSKQQLKSPPQQIYALASETCKWSAVLKEIIDNSELLRHERKLTPILALLLVHDFLLSRKGIALPASHGLRAAVERHKARLTSELTRARLRRKAASIDALRELVTIESLGEAGLYPRWVRVNTLKATLQEQLDTTFKDFTRVSSVRDVIAASTTGKLLYVDEHVPNLLALSPTFEITKTHAYTSGAIILQDKASCFPAYLLDPRPEDGDVIDSCSAPGNKTTHVAAIVKSRISAHEKRPRKVYAFEKDQHRARTLDKMVHLAGAQEITKMSPGQDFLKVDPDAPAYKNVGALLLDPSCSGSGIVGRDTMPTIHLPEQQPGAKQKQTAPTKNKNGKRKREEENDDTQEDRRQKQKQILVDDDGQELVVSSEKEMKARLEALSSFQLTLLLHAFSFPAARRVTYSTCSVHAEENEHVVLKALQSDIALERGWRIMKRDTQVEGMRSWPVRGSLEASRGDEEVAEACIRSYKDDGRGVMGFFVAGFVRDAGDTTNGNTPEVKGAKKKLRGSGIPHVTAQNGLGASETESDAGEPDGENDGDDDEWGGFAD
ncbi:S-adenosyl-L-methionine-dependent methyltransferase [Xylaria bambusicola]|uniref:S-adenosyl-L-methionine-dependent methyltransferase n=1 Tax=Xylaria bambusicola TaxID=326684 RepID=UPI002007B954|nr:S-adenosyl-L-methionine-dependent methyltransferase [Xylaria bambusicola]KAI0512784.1 S-adenosyl-L-methionine-dependent methyltransferase [Xylaria bambusicola]